MTNNGAAWPSKGRSSAGRCSNRSLGSYLRKRFSAGIGTLVTEMKKIAVGSRELKTRLGTYLRKVQKGQIPVITDRGRPVAELTPVRVHGNDESRALAELAAIGLLTRQFDAPLERLQGISAKRPLSNAVVEDREDRF